MQLQAINHNIARQGCHQQFTAIQFTRHSIAPFGAGPGINDRFTIVRRQSNPLTNIIFHFFCFSLQSSSSTTTSIYLLRVRIVTSRFVSRSTSAFQYAADRPFTISAAAATRPRLLAYRRTFAARRLHDAIGHAARVITHCAGPSHRPGAAQSPPRRAAGAPSIFAADQVITAFAGASFGGCLSFIQFAQSLTFNHCRRSCRVIRISFFTGRFGMLIAFVTIDALLGSATFVYAFATAALHCWLPPPRCPLLLRRIRRFARCHAILCHWHYGYAGSGVGLAARGRWPGGRGMR